MTSLTPGNVSRISGSAPPCAPVTPMAVRCAPGMGWALRPIFSTCLTMASICSGRAPASMTTSMTVSIIERPMKKILLLLAAALLVSPQLFAYWVVLKDGSKYDAVDKPVITGNKATVKLKSGQTIVVAAAQIDAANSEEVTRLGGGQLLGVEQRVAPTG